MPGTDLQAEALAIALRHAPPEVGVAVWCQIVNAPSRQNGQRGKAPAGEIPAWMLLLTMSDPINLVGDKLRHFQAIGNGAPNLAVIPGAVENGLTQLRTLARQRLASQS